MKIELNITERKPIWFALSKFYLDTELQDYDFKSIASIVKKSPYTFEEIKEIDRQELFPILHWNLLWVAGVWTGFDEEWLLEEILKRIHKTNRFRNYFMGLKYAMQKSMYANSWKKLEAAYNQD